MVQRGKRQHLVRKLVLRCLRELAFLLSVGAIFAYTVLLNHGRFDGRMEFQYAGAYGPSDIEDSMAVQAFQAWEQAPSNWKCSTEVGEMINAVRMQSCQLEAGAHARRERWCFLTGLEI